MLQTQTQGQESFQCLLDDKNIMQNQLSLGGVKEEDVGKYNCVTKSSAGETPSKYAFLSIKHLDEVADWYSL